MSNVFFTLVLMNTTVFINNVEDPYVYEDMFEDPFKSEAELLAQKSCLHTVIINKSNEAWNNVDASAQKAAKDRCPSITSGRSPCLKTFTKMAPRTYRALCTWKR